MKRFISVIALTASFVAFLPAPANSVTPFGIKINLGCWQYGDSVSVDLYLQNSSKYPEAAVGTWYLIKSGVVYQSYFDSSNINRPDKVRETINGRTQKSFTVKFLVGSAEKSALSRQITGIYLAQTPRSTPVAIFKGKVCAKWF